MSNCHISRLRITSVYPKTHSNSQPIRYMSTVNTKQPIFPINIQFISYVSSIFSVDTVDNGGILVQYGAKLVNRNVSTIVNQQPVFLHFQLFTPKITPFCIKKCQLSVFNMVIFHRLESSPRSGTGVVLFLSVRGGCVGTLFSAIRVGVHNSRIGWWILFPNPQTRP